MKKLSLLLAMFVATTLAASAQAFNNVTITWSPNPLNVTDGWPNCNFASNPLDICVEGYTVTEVTNATTGLPTAPVVLASACTATVTTNCLSASATSFVVTPLPTPVPHTYTIVTNGLNATGGADPSAAATVTVTVPTPSPLAPVNAAGSVH